MCINCDGLRSVDKRAELNCLDDNHNPHIILGQESRLGPDIPSCEVFPKGFKSFRRDRVMGGGGVFILVRDDILRMLFQMTIKYVRVFGSILNSSMQNY